MQSTDVSQGAVPQKGRRHIHLTPPHIFHIDFISHHTWSHQVRSSFHWDSSFQVYSDVADIQAPPSAPLLMANTPSSPPHLYYLVPILYSITFTSLCSFNLSPKVHWRSLDTVPHPTIPPHLIALDGDPDTTSITLHPTTLWVPSDIYNDPHRPEAVLSVIVYVSLMTLRNMQLWTFPYPNPNDA